MTRLTAADLLTPGQARAKRLQRDFALNRAKFEFEHNTAPQYFNGQIIRAFQLRDGCAYIEFQQFHSNYQVILKPHEAAHPYVLAIIKAFKTNTRHSITVKGSRGRLNEKGVCSVIKVTYIK